MNAAGPTTASQQPSQPRERGIVIREPSQQLQLEKPKVEASDKSEDLKVRRKRKKPFKPVKKAPMQLTLDHVS